MKLTGEAGICIIKYFAIYMYLLGNNLKIWNYLDINITVFWAVTPVVLQKYTMLSEKPAAYIFRVKDTQNVCIKMHAQLKLVALNGKACNGRMIHRREENININLKNSVTACGFFLALSRQVQVQSVSLPAVNSAAHSQVQWLVTFQ